MRAMQSHSAEGNGAQRSDGEVTVITSADELALLCNAINESLEAVEEWEYHLRLGATRDQALALHSQMRALLDAIEPPSDSSAQV